MKKEIKQKMILVCSILIVVVVVVSFYSKSEGFKVYTNDKDITVGTNSNNSNWQMQAGDITDNVDFNDAKSLSSAGDKYFESKNYIQAIELYKKALSIDPSDVDTYNDLGLALHYTGNSSMAIETLEKGIRINSTYQRIRLSLGFILMSVGRVEKAKAALTKTRDMDSSSRMGQEATRMLSGLNNK